MVNVPPAAEEFRLSDGRPVTVHEKFPLPPAATIVPVYGRLTLAGPRVAGFGAGSVTAL
jgi:hypothetical protein